ncbi:hypothetical protein HHI36_016170, partial [Cryptolaemus montrouzieri]
MASGDDIATGKRCKRCHIISRNGVKCVKCGKSMHAACLKYFSNIVNVNEREIICCDNSLEDNTNFYVSMNENKKKECISDSTISRLKKTIQDKDFTIKILQTNINFLQSQLRTQSISDSSEQRRIEENREFSLKCSEEFLAKSVKAKQKPSVSTRPKIIPKPRFLENITTSPGYKQQKSSLHEMCGMLPNQPEFSFLTAEDKPPPLPVKQRKRSNLPQNERNPSSENRCESTRNNNNIKPPIAKRASLHSEQKEIKLKPSLPPRRLQLYPCGFVEKESVKDSQNFPAKPVKRNVVENILTVEMKEQIFNALIAKEKGERKFKTGIGDVSKKKIF